LKNIIDKVAKLYSQATLFNKPATILGALNSIPKLN